MGQQSLPIFMLTMALSYVGGMILDQFGHGIAILAIVNLGGCALLLLAARTMAWLKSSPWKVQAERGACGSAGQDGEGASPIPLFATWPSGLKQTPAVVFAGFVAAAPLYLSQKGTDAQYSMLAMHGAGRALVQDHGTNAAGDEADQAP